MRLPIDFQPLRQVRETMGAEMSAWTPRREQTAELEPFERRVSRQEVDQIVPLDGVGPLVYQGEQILLYIKDTRLDLHTLIHDPENSPRFHIAECETIEQMRRGNRFERYVMTNRIESNFKVEATDPNTGTVEELETELYVCKNCLKALDLRNDRSNWPAFSMAAFFRNHETFFSDLPRHTDATAPPGGYTENWEFISRTYRAQQRWTCEECRVRLDNRENHRLLHCHHKNGVVSDNRPENLQALCVECHARQPGHGRYPPNDEERELLGRLREDQGVRL